MLGAALQVLAVYALHSRKRQQAERLHGLPRDRVVEHGTERAAQELADGHLKTLLGTVKDLVGQMSSVGVHEDAFTLATVDLERRR